MHYNQLRSYVCIPINEWSSSCTRIYNYCSKGEQFTRNVLRQFVNSFPPNDTMWCHHGHGLSIRLWELTCVYGEFIPGNIL